jgi:hypothetical protein
VNGVGFSFDASHAAAGVSDFDAKLVSPLRTLPPLAPAGWHGLRYSEGRGLVQGHHAVRSTSERATERKRLAAGAAARA